MSNITIELTGLAYYFWMTLASLYVIASIMFIGGAAYKGFSNTKPVTNPPGKPSEEATEKPERQLSVGYVVQDLYGEEEEIPPALTIESLFNTPIYMGFNVVDWYPQHLDNHLERTRVYRIVFEHEKELKFRFNNVDEHRESPYHNLTIRCAPGLYYLTAAGREYARAGYDLLTLEGDNNVELPEMVLLNPDKNIISIEDITEIVHNGYKQETTQTDEETSDAVPADDVETQH